MIDVVVVVVVVVVNGIDIGLSSLSRAAAAAAAATWIDGSLRNPKSLPSNLRHFHRLHWHLHHESCRLWEEVS
jgi:hypothetical protein